MMRKTVQYVNGYRLIYMPGHPRALNGSGLGGYVYEHIIVAEQSLGRPLRKSEVVHHLDLDRSNNAACNLLILSNSQHGRLHRWIDKGCPIVNKPTTTIWKKSKKQKRVDTTCKTCGKQLQTSQKMYCSLKCFHDAKPTQRPSKVVLQERIKKPFLNWEEIGREYGVTGNSVRKWARKYGLPVPTKKRRNRTAV